MGCAGGISSAETDCRDGGMGADQLFGEGGNDRLYGDDGFADTLSGGAGDDVFITVDSVVDQINGDSGHDAATADAADLLSSIEGIVPGD